MRMANVNDDYCVGISISMFSCFKMSENKNNSRLSCKYSVVLFFLLLQAYLGQFVLEAFYNFSFWTINVCYDFISDALCCGPAA